LGSESQTNDVSPTSKSAVAITRTEEQVLRQEEDKEVMTSQGRIRSWGCGNTNTPFIFVHIGKAGGGNIRHRIASSRLNITSNTKNQRYQDLLLNSSGAYFPVATTLYTRIALITLLLACCFRETLSLDQGLREKICWHYWYQHVPTTRSQRATRTLNGKQQIS
jgi:hypothetical protein